MRRVILGPTFEVVMDVPAAVAAERLGAGLGGTGLWVRRSGAPGGCRDGCHFLMTVGREDRWFWSPWLTFEFVPTEGGCVGHGRFNPSPAIWTGFVLASMAMLVLAVGGLMWSTAEWMLSRPPRGLWLTTAACLGIAGLYAVSAVGQRLAKGQMDSMEATVRGLVGQSAGG